MVKKLGQRLWLFCVFVFLYAPIFVLIVYSFTSSTMIGAIRGFSLEHYVTLFTTKELLHMIGGTLLLAVTVAFFVHSSWNHWCNRFLLRWEKKRAVHQFFESDSNCQCRSCNWF